MNKILSLRFQQIFVLAMCVLFVILLVFYGYRSENYSYLNDKDVSDCDIYAQRSFIDTYATKTRAEEAKKDAPVIYVRQDSVAEENVLKVRTFFNLVRETRDLLRSDAEVDYDTEVNNLKRQLNSTLGYNPSSEVLADYLGMTYTTFNLIEERTVEIADIIMRDSIYEGLEGVISSQVVTFVTNNPAFAVYSDSISNALNGLLTINVVFNEDATNDSRTNAYNEAINDPVIVEKGSKILSVGEEIDAHKRSMLTDLELIRSDSYDLIIIGRIACYEFIIAIVVFIYIANYRNKSFADMKVVYTIVVTFIIPIAASAVYLHGMSSIMVVTLFFTTIAATYLGLSLGIILSLAQLLMLWPLYNFDIEFLFVSFIGVLICSSIASNTKKSYNSAALIISPAITCILASVVYNWISVSTLNDYIQSAIWTGVSAMLSVVIAIGLMPIYELFSRTVSPVKLIELSQPGRPLLKRMFIEASGTYHHSMMVANLADSAAEAIGADSLLCKVAAYYHDIGKLENPKYFTENQAEGVNPHDDRTVEDSVEIITNHILDGAKLAKQHRLPEPIIRIIDEHHGTTYPAYFYFKAKKIAAENGAPEPNIDDFKYKGHIPSTRESAIVMIADTCEAAIRSMKLTDPVEIEKTIRDLIKKKIDQDQLSMSGLSFDDLEKIIVSFRQAYAGTFHERIQYPNEK